MRRYGILLLLLSIRLLPGLQPGGGYMCEAGCTKWGIPDSLVPGTVGYHPKPRTFGNRLVGVSSVGHRSVCLGYLARRMNQSIVGLSPLSETA
jgi:hypothetical protein